MRELRVERVQQAWFSWADAAKYTGLCERTLQKVVARGEIKAKLFTTGDGKTGRRRRMISRASLDEWIESLPESA